MPEGYSPERQQQETTSFLHQLYREVIEVGPKSRDALARLSSMATAGQEEARDLIDEIDFLVSNGELTIPSPETRRQKSPSKLSDALVVLSHPLDSFKARGWQISVSLEQENPPLGHTFESFPFLPLADAVLILRSTRPFRTGGVPEEAWSKADRERLKRGEEPKGYPEHPNV